MQHRDVNRVQADSRDPLVEQYEHSLDLELDQVIPLVFWIVAALIVVILVGLYLIASNIDWRALMDFLSPTAAQARDMGAHNLMERF